MSLVEALLLVAGGLLAGFVNTVAGGGSVVTIPILIEILGGNAVLANGTNRVAILLQNIVGVLRFQRGGKISWRLVLPMLPAVLLGAAAGTWVATVIDPRAMRKVFAVVVVLVALSVLVKPSRWLGGHASRLPEPWRTLLFFAGGFYGGFVQAGVGFILLAGLVLGGGLDLVRGNAAKLLLVLVYTPLSLALFALSGNVEWVAGLVLGAGNATGAFVAASLALKKGAAGWIRWVVVLAALGAAARMLLS